MIICSSSNIDLIQGVSGYGTAADGATDWRIENTATGVFNILNSPNLLTPNVSIIDAGNIGIGTIPVSGTNKLQVQGDTSVTGLITATRTTAGTNDILAMRYDSNNGIRFQQTLVAANDVRYDIIQKTNNADYTTPAISIYKGNVGIGTTNPNAELQITCTSTATNPDTGGTIIGLYVHNPSNTASQNSVILNRIAGTTAAKVIYAFNVAGSYGCSLSINGSDTTDRLLRFNSNSDATGTDLMVINNSNGNVSIGNVVTATYKLNITGGVNVSGGYFVGGVAFKPATAVLADTATALATSRNIAGVGFNGTGAIDIPYPNLTNKLTSGTGITISAATPPVISTNLSAGTNVTFTGTAPNITINAAGGAASQWTTTGANIYYNSGNVGIGTNNPTNILHLHANATSADVRMVFTDNTTTTGNLRGFHIGKSTGNDTFLWNHETAAMMFATTNVERMRITSTGNVGIGTNNPLGKLHINGEILSMPLAAGASWDHIRLSHDGELARIDAGGSTSMVFSIENTATAYPNATYVERMRITSTGNVGIGTATPGFRLEVTGNTSAGVFTAYYLGGAGVSSFYGDWGNTCAKFTGGVWTTTHFMVSSDIRIKEDIQDIIDDTALQSILSIEPKTYKYVDKLERGYKKVYGFIAQQIKDVIPEAVSIQASYIPNIYLVADYIDCVITLSSQPTKVIIKMNDKIKCYDKDNKEILVEVIEVIDDLTFRIKEIEYTDTKIFVYGTFVDDFHTLNKDYIFTLNVCATQELHRRIEAQSVVIKSYEDRIKDLETKVATLMSNM